MIYTGDYYQKAEKSPSLCRVILFRTPFVTHMRIKLHPRNNESVETLKFGPLPPFEFHNTQDLMRISHYLQRLLVNQQRPRKNRTDEEKSKEEVSDTNSTMYIVP